MSYFSMKSPYGVRSFVCDQLYITYMVLKSLLGNIDACICLSERNKRYDREYVEINMKILLRIYHKLAQMDDLELCGMNKDEIEKFIKERRKEMYGE